MTYLVIFIALVICKTRLIWWQNSDWHAIFFGSNINLLLILVAGLKFSALHIIELLVLFAQEVLIRSRHIITTLQKSGFIGIHRVRNLDGSYRVQRALMRKLTSARRAKLVHVLTILLLVDSGCRIGYSRGFPTKAIEISTQSIRCDTRIS